MEAISRDLSCELKKIRGVTFYWMKVLTHKGTAHLVLYTQWYVTVLEQGRDFMKFHQKLGKELMCLQATAGSDVVPVISRSLA